MARRPEPGSAGRALVVTASARVATGVQADLSGPILVDGLQRVGFLVDGPVVMSDGEQVERALRSAVAAEYDVVLTTGGTGLSPTDRTPEATSRVLDAEIPGIAERIRHYAVDSGAEMALVFRGLAGRAGRTLIVNLPGSPKECRDGVVVVARIAPRAVEQLRGDNP